MKKSSMPQKRKIVWARNMLLDTDLFAKPEIEILHHLTERHYEIFYVSGYSKQKHQFKNSDIHLFSVPLGRKNLPLKYHLILAFVQLLSFPFYLLRKKPDFIIVDWDSIFGLMPMLPACRLLRVKVILDIRSTPTPIRDLQEKAGLRRRLLSFMFNVSVHIAKKEADGMTIITDLMRKELCDKFHIDPNWVGVWSSGVSAKFFRYEECVQNVNQLKERLGLTNRFIACYHGAFVQSRGLMDAIDAMPIVRGRYPEVVLFLLGNGSAQFKNDMRTAIQKSGLENSVVLHDAVDHAEIPKYIAMCDVGIVPLPDLPQWRNQCPLKLLEYLAMQKPVILTDIPCHREIVGTAKCGIYFSSPSRNGIAESIAFAYDNKENLKEWGAKGRKIVEKRYSWEMIAEDLANYLTRIENK